MHLENTLSTLNDLEKGKADEVKKSLNSIMDLHTIRVKSYKSQLCQMKDLTLNASVFMLL
jgi:hypothetical protein